MDNGNNPEFVPSMVLLLDWHIRAFYTARDAFTRAGLRTHFDQRLGDLNPESPHGSLHESRLEHERSVAGPSILISSPYQMPIITSTWDATTMEIPECQVPEAEGEEVVTDDDYRDVNDQLSTESLSEGTENDELEILAEIQNSESSIAKTLKGTPQVMTTPKMNRIPITHNLLGRYGKPRATFPNGDGTPNSGNRKSQPTPEKPSNKQRSNGRRRLKRPSPYKPPQKESSDHFIEHQQKQFIADGLLEIDPNGKITFSIEKIMERFGENKEELKEIKAKRARKAPSLTADEKQFAATCVVQCLRNGFKRIDDNLDEACNKLYDHFFYTISNTPERWKVICNGILDKK